MAKSGFNFKQYERWAKNLHVATEEFELFLKQFLLEMAQRCIAKTKKRTPVDTGALRNSWSIGSQKIELRGTGKFNKKTGHELVEIDPDKSDVASILVVGNTMYVEIYNSMEYSLYVEKGHSQEPGRYVPAIGKTLKRDWVEGKFMLTISIDEIRQQIPARFSKAFKEFIKRYEV